MTSETDTQHPFFALRSHWFYNLAIVVTGVLIFVFVPLFILTPGQTKQYLNNGRELQVLLDVGILILCFYIVIGALYWLLTLIKKRDVGASFVMLVLSWVALSGFLLPLTSARGMLELRFAPTHWLNLSLVTILSLGLTVLFMSRHVKIVQVFMGIFLTVSILPTLPRAFSQFEQQDAQVKGVQLSADKNILVVGFDGLPGHLVKEVLTASSEFSQTFKDFTFYENVTSSSPGTEASMLGIVYGNHDFTTWKDASTGDMDSLYFNQDDKVNVTTSFKYNVFNKNGTKLAAGQYGIPEQRDQLIDLYRNVAVRLTTAHGVNLIDGIDFQYFPNRKGKFYSTVEGFDKIIGSLGTGSDKPSVFYTHFTFSHRPPSVDENCRYRRMDFEWMMSHQNLDGLRKGTICSLKKYTEFIAKLKQLGIYDQTMIVLLSDHGKTVMFYDTPPHNLRINNGPELGFDRYQPFLMIKPFAQKNDALEISDRPVLLDDLAQTNCYVFEGSDVCENMPGMNILDPTDIPPESFYIHVVKDETSNWMVVDHKAVKLPRDVPLLDAMKASPDIQLSESP